jgi:catechol 2,3-dioxygenase-like lactoylglutathione lyase family enzyme
MDPRPPDSSHAGNPPPEFTGVLETVLYYPPGLHDRMAAFYDRVMGFRSIGRSPDHFLFYRAGASVVLLFNREAAAHQDSPPPHGASGPGHICFMVPAASYEEWKARLVEEGVALEEEVEWPRGGRSFYFRDPAGNALEIANRDVWPA